MNTVKDYYRLLEVHPEASAEMIERAKRLLVQRYHPDHNRERPEWAAEKTRLVLEAYAVLSDPQQREAYDAARKERRRQDERRARATGPPPSRSPTRPAPDLSHAHRRASARTRKSTNVSELERDLPAGFRIVVCASCGTASRVRKNRPLHEVTCGACGEPLRPRLRRRIGSFLRRQDARLERLRAAILRLIRRLPTFRRTRRKKEKSSQ